MRRLPHTNKLGKAILDAISPIFTEASTKERDDVGARIMDTLHGRQRRPFESIPKLSRDEYFATRMFRCYSEVHQSLERLKDIETMVARYTLSGTRVTRAAYLRFVVEGQLHELYLLQERLLGWLAAVERAYKRDRRATAVAAVTQKLRDGIRNHFRTLANVRGSHVHLFRYDNQEIERLELIDLLSLSSDKKLLKTIRFLRQSVTQDTHARLKRQVLDWNKVAAIAVEAVHKLLAEILFQSSGRGFAYPVPVKKPNPAVHPTLRDNAAQRR